MTKANMVTTSRVRPSRVNNRNRSLDKSVIAMRQPLAKFADRLPYQSLVQAAGCIYININSIPIF